MSYPNSHYTVGWICALSTEYVAAQAFLDERHVAPSVAIHDNNNYTLGRIGEHKVIIAVLPDGEYGLASAANVAKDLLHSFPNVRIGLMVGIGGGAPSQTHDIRLGDVVVSAPRNGTGGIFQYDYGKTTQNKSFQATAFLNQPPAVLRTAIGGLKAQHESEGHQYEATINNILKDKPRLKKRYSRPAQSSDRLYQSDFVHPRDTRDSCEDICDAAKLISRPERNEYEDNPAIHYGLIASANQMMEDAIIRDELVASKDVLCFETEAAGLMNQYPCLVIRGICDYSDSHKTEQWQGYAAMVAAAYAKDLLYRIPINKVEAETRVGDLLLQGTVIIELAICHLSNVLLVTDAVDQIRHTAAKKEDNKILDWITPSEYGPQHSDYIKKRQAGTGQWLLDSAEYNNWLTKPNQTLFCPGIPGAGKTILTAVVIDDLTAKLSSKLDIGLAYIYCNFKRQGEQKFEDLMASLLKQLSRRAPSIPDCMKKLYDAHESRRTRPTIAEIAQALRTVAVMFSQIFIIVDALDECDTSNHSRSNFLSSIVDLRKDINTNIFATSRYIPDIEKVFQGSLKREILASDADMRKYIDSHMRHLPDFISRREDIKDQIKSELIQAAQGMFLLVALYLDALKDKTSISEVKSGLKNLHIHDTRATDEGGLHTALEQAYKDAMERIDRQGPDRQRLGKQVISWITCAKRPLMKPELQHALAVRLKDRMIDEDNIREIEIILSVCAGLVTVDEESGIIRLVHYTAQEFFDQTRYHWFPDAEREITKICCTYLSFDVFGSGFASRDDFEKRLLSNPLYNYAAANWGHHARGLPDLPGEVEQFIACQAKVEASSQVAMGNLSYFAWGEFEKRIDNEFDYPPETTGLHPPETTGLHLAAFFGVRRGVAFLLQHENELDLTDFLRMTPLAYAAQNGHEATARLLLKEGASVDGDSEYYEVGDWTPLHVAASEGHETVVQLLLEEGAEVDATDDHGYTALLLAVNANHENIVRLLLEKGALIDTKNHSGSTPLISAAGRGLKNIVQLLLEKGASTETGDYYGFTPIFYAARNGSNDMAQLLLEKGASINTKNNWGSTPLSFAVWSGKDIVQFFLEKGASIDEKDKYGYTPLLRAAEDGNIGVVRLLLERGAIAKGALAHAARGRHVALVQLLLDQGLPIEDEDCFGSTALLSAVDNKIRDGGNSLETILLLLERGAAIEARGNDGETALLRASESSRIDNIKLLLDKGAAIEARDNGGNTALMRAASLGQIANIEFLLDRGAAIEARDNGGNTVLLRASERFGIDYIKLLLDKGAAIEARDNGGNTALMRAASLGRVANVEFLLDRGASIEEKNISGETALMIAASNEEFTTVELLLDRGAAIVVEDSDEHTGSSQTSKKEHEFITWVLLQRELPRYEAIE
ncbi:Ankyrin repeat domain-containing protein 17 [Trichoderma lentiforme]|uniref:protein S-acyltransferase n=1 Tax=Trichoderma lentiforme TaxID=1567552 RepID=A0A9P5CC65_9HYPO|nr:Ankyrin repeat domain-containing protein 17 [Trichoderma lentiforme]